MFCLMYANPLYHEQTKHDEFRLRYSQGLELLWGFLAKISIFPETDKMTGHSFWVQEKMPKIFLVIWLLGPNVKLYFDLLIYFKINIR